MFAGCARTSGHVFSLVRCHPWSWRTRRAGLAAEARNWEHKTPDNITHPFPDYPFEKLFYRWRIRRLWIKKYFSARGRTRERKIVRSCELVSAGMREKSQGSWVFVRWNINRAFPRINCQRPFICSPVLLRQLERTGVCRWSPHRWYACFLSALRQPCNPSRLSNKRKSFVIDDLRYRGFSYLLTITIYLSAMESFLEQVLEQIGNDRAWWMEVDRRWRQRFDFGIRFRRNWQSGKDRSFEFTKRSAREFRSAANFAQIKSSLRGRKYLQQRLLNFP